MRPLLVVPGLDGVHSATGVVFARPRVPQAVGAENPVMSCDLDLLVGLPPNWSKWTRRPRSGPAKAGPWPSTIPSRAACAFP